MIVHLSNQILSPHHTLPTNYPPPLLSLPFTQTRPDRVFFQPWCACKLCWCELSLPPAWVSYTIVINSKSNRMRPVGAMNNLRIPLTGHLSVRPEHIRTGLCYDDSHWRGCVTRWPWSGPDFYLLSHIIWGWSLPMTENVTYVMFALIGWGHSHVIW